MKPTILYIEDNKDDVLLTKLGFQSLGLEINLKDFNNGLKAIDFLKFENILPDLILLDINLPINNGFEILKELKSLEKNSKIPIVVFTSSDSPQDMQMSYLSGADLFIRKPNNLQGFKKALLQILFFLGPEKINLSNIRLSVK